MAPLLPATRLRGRPARRADPVRTCVGCRRRGPLGDFVRLARAADMAGDTATGDRVKIGRNVPGRGAWLCVDRVECFEQAVQRRAINRALRIELSDQEISVLRARLHGTPPAGAQPDGRAPLGGG